MPIIRDFNKDLVPMDNFIEARKNDLIRVTEFFNSGKGLAFAGKQALLRTSPALTKLADPSNTQADKALIKQEAIQGAKDAASHLVTILAQVPVNGTGTHFLYNDILRLVQEPGNLFYAGNGNAANEALYGGVITIGKSNKRRGKQTWDEQGFAPTGKSDDIGLSGVIKNIDLSEDTNNTADVIDRTRELISKDSLPIVFSIVGEPVSTLVFRGFIQGLSDSFSANWSAYQYVGRGEPMYTYTGGTRGINYTMMIPVFSAKEQKPTYRKLNSLLSYTYPKYVNNLPQGTVAKMRIGDYINCYGVITSMNVTVGQDVPWSTPESEYINGVEVPIQRILPQVINLTISINIIHERLPERELDNRPRYIGNQAFLGEASATTTGVENEQVLEDGQ